MSVCDLKSFVEDMKRMDYKDNTEETAKKEFKDLINGEIDEIKYVKYDDIYEELFEEYSKEYDLKREEGKYWGITITRGEENE